MESLNSIDTQLFIFLNQLHNGFFDVVMYWMSHKLFWVPMYLFIIYIVIKKYKTKGLVIILFTILVIALCDQTTSHLIKNLVKRLRPSHEPSLLGLVHLSKAGAGGMYGFVSSHAANAFGLATFLSLVLDNKFKILKYWLFAWAIVVSYSRIYNGVHYPGDVIGGALVAILISWLMALLYKKVEVKWFPSDKLKV